LKLIRQRLNHLDDRGNSRRGHGIYQRSRFSLFYNVHRKPKMI
jgi:hypothetical protein